MKTKNADQFFRHVCNLQTISGVESYHEALIIYRKLHRIEARCNRIFTDECNGDRTGTEEEQEKQDERILKSVCALLPSLKTIFLNGDPRGYALKIKSEEQKELRDKGVNLCSDWGGYGILAPEF